jgi:hypothetical protein
VRALLLVLLCVGCGPGRGPNVPVTGEIKKLPVGPPLVTPGERMIYRVHAGPLHVANYALTVGQPESLDGRAVITVVGHAQAVGLAEVLGGKVDDRFTSWIDVQTGRSVRFRVDEYATKSSDIEHTVEDLAKRSGNTIPIMFHVNDGTPAPEPQIVTMEEIWDYNAFLVALRSWEAAPGTRFVAEVFRSRFLWNVTVTVHGKTKLETELGELPALRFDCHGYKIARDGSKFPADERDFSIWISDDAGRVPLLTEAQTDYGPIKMQIVEYTAGAGEPLRK